MNAWPNCATRSFKESTTGRYFKCILFQQPVVDKLKLSYASRSCTFTKILPLSWLIASSYLR
uniref:Putative ovule protein n=1 Tax=Solanum chacoense TaxID=4108 RepID=A0A0V0GS62_SOLCH